MGNVIQGTCFKCKGKGAVTTKNGSKIIAAACDCPAGIAWGQRMAAAVEELLGPPDAVLSSPEQAT